MVEGAADADVMEPAEVAHRDPPGLVDAVVADPVVDRWWRRGGAGLEARVEGVQGRVAVQSAMGADLVVVRAEGVELSLMDRQRGGRSLLGEVLLEGLVEALDLAAGLGVIGRGVFGEDAEALEFGSRSTLPLRVLPLKTAPLSVRKAAGWPYISQAV